MRMQGAIAALHAQGAAATDWAGIERLYAALEQMQPSPVVTLNRTVAVSKVSGPAALALIEPLEGALGGYFCLHGLRGALLAELGREAEARDAFGRAIALANTPAEAAHIRDRLDQLEGHARARGKS
jgi:RNA polymerase sigma-70 factor, ECF subfamily